MLDKEFWNFSERLNKGLKLAGQRMLQEKALRGEDIIISPDGKTIKRIAAKKFIKTKKK